MDPRVGVQGRIPRELTLERRAAGAPRRTGSQMKHFVQDLGSNFSCDEAERGDGGDISPRAYRDSITGRENIHASCEQ